MAVRGDRVEGRKRVNAALQAMIAEADEARHRRFLEEGRGRLLLRRRQCARTGAQRRRSRRGGVPARRSRHLDAGEEGRHQSRGVRHSRQQGPGLAARPTATHWKTNSMRAGANWQMLTFGGRLHSFAEEETDMPGVAKYRCRRRAPDLSHAGRFHPGCVREAAVAVSPAGRPNAWAPAGDLIARSLLDDCRSSTLPRPHGLHRGHLGYRNFSGQKNLDFDPECASVHSER